MAVIVLHYNNPHAYSALGVKMYLCLMTSVCACAVNVFILITGYFSCLSDKRSIGKPISLIFQVILCKEFFYIIRMGFGNLDFSLKGLIFNLIPNNYFIILYVTLFCISPFINRAIRNMSSYERRTMLLILLILFSLWASFSDIISSIKPIMGLSTIGIYGSQSGYTIINFALVYIIGACIRLGDFKADKNGNIYLLFYLLIVVFITILGYFEYNRTDDIMNVSAWYYCSPLVILEAACIFLFFKSISFKSKLINHLSKAALFSFLIQSFFLNNLKIGVYAQKSLIVFMVHMVVSIVIIYLSAFIMCKIYNLIFGPLQAKLDKILIPYSKV